MNSRKKKSNKKKNNNNKRGVFLFEESKQKYVLSLLIRKN